MTRPTRRYVRGSGYQPSVAFTPWDTLLRFRTYDAAKAALDEQALTGLRQYAIFYRGKPYREIRSITGDLLRRDTGAQALR